ncbi:MAG TPA: DinB family protein [Candidatus Eisenbacteria bacterium]|jgi:uncharacterized damage-inducible protein DinB
MPRLTQRFLDPGPGAKSRAIGLFLWQLDDQTRRLKEDTRGATPEELAWQPAPGMNTIGMLLAHVAVVETHWIGASALGLEWSTIQVLPVTRQDTGIPLPAGAAPPEALHGKDLAFFDDLLDRARAYTRSALAPLAEADLDRRFVRRRPDGTEFEANVAWAIYHVLEHEAGHYGQINLLRHQYRLARAPLRA